VPFSNSSVDRVTCRFGVMFFADIDTAFTEMLRVPKPGDEPLFWRGGGSSNLSSRDWGRFAHDPWGKNAGTG
jgi:ubiquinone/menaquinone biosynthesis C-methylase UbiE